MMDSVISLFSEKSNNMLPVFSKLSFLASALNLPFYPIFMVPSISGFQLLRGGKHDKNIESRECLKCLN